MNYFYIQVNRNSLVAVVTAARMTQRLEPDRLEGVTRDSGETPLDDGSWFRAADRWDALVYDVPDGTMADHDYLTFDALLSDPGTVLFQMDLVEESGGLLAGVRRYLPGIDPATRAFSLAYRLLPQCSARIRLPLDHVELDTWMFPREGAWLRPVVGGQRIDLEDVDRIRIEIYRKHADVARWCQTPLAFTEEEPEPIEDPVLPEGTLLDKLGQSRLYDWPERTSSEQQLVSRLRSQHEAAESYTWPEEYSAWGGGSERRFEATGYFRVERTADRWVLVDPDGHPFWSSGVVGVRGCVKTNYRGLEDALEWIPERGGRYGDALGNAHCDDTDYDPPEVLNYLAANFIRAFPDDDWWDAWRTATEGQLHRFGFNTIGSHSERPFSRDSEMPYVRTLDLRFPRSKEITMDFPDVFDDSFVEDAEGIAEQLAETSDDPAMVGYFLGNEPSWLVRQGADETPAVGMLYETSTCKSREGLATYLEQKYDGSLQDAWGIEKSYDDLRESEWNCSLPDVALSDLREFSKIMVSRYYDVICRECEKVDGNHLNFGTRFLAPPPVWMRDVVSKFDALSFNTYTTGIPGIFEDLAEEAGVPLLVTEWSFGALDVGTASGGACETESQIARSERFRIFLENAISNPKCIGAHYFRLYDLSALGRTDGETDNAGLLDVCHRPYYPMLHQSKRAHARMYELLDGEVEPYDAPSLDIKQWQ